MTESNGQRVGRGAVYIFIETTISFILGYVFWLFLSKITTSEIIGTSSAVVSLAAIFTTVVNIGIPTGVQRFLGKSFSEQQLEDAKVFLKGSIFLISIGTLALSIVILIVRGLIYDIFRMDFSLIIVSILLTGSFAIATLFRSIIISSLNTKVLPMRTIVSSIAKVVLAIVLVLMGTGVLGLTIAYLFNYVISSILLSFNIIDIFKVFRPSKNKPQVSFNDSCKRILAASVPTWIPALITTIGAQLGTVIVFGSEGASEAGAYFIAFSIYSAISAIVYSLFSAAYPALSGMHDRRKRFTWQLIKISLFISIPFSSSFIFYSNDIMQLVGRDYIKGSLPLEYLLLSMLPTAMLSGINVLVYSYGNYRQVLAIGLASSIPRTVLYFILVPIYGSAGAALSYTIGSVIGFAVSIVIAKQIEMIIFWKDLAYIFIIPTGVAFILGYSHMNYIVGILITYIISYVLLLKLRILTGSDIKSSVGILPYSISNPIIKVLNIVGKKSNRTY
jgi:O-antigen/teichoic acid export membrane protein